MISYTFYIFSGGGSGAMKKIFKKLGSLFSKNKLRSTTYQFVGFGGVQEQPHSYTVDNNLALSKKVSALKRFSNPKYSHRFHRFDFPHLFP